MLTTNEEDKDMTLKERVYYNIPISAGPGFQFVNNRLTPILNKNQSVQQIDYDIYVER